MIQSPLCNNETELCGLCERFYCPSCYTCCPRRDCFSEMQKVAERRATEQSKGSNGER